MSKSYKLFIFFVAFYGLLLAAFNVKSYILIFLAAFSALFFYFKFNLIQSVFIILVLSLPFENNLREWVYQVTEPLYTSVPTSGYTYFFGLSLKLVFGIFLFLLLVFNKKPLNISFKHDWPLIVFFAIACINTFFYSSTISYLGLLRLWLSVLIYFSAKIFFKQDPKLFPIILSALFIFSTYIGSLQLLRQKPLGNFIELTPGFSENDGYSTTDGQTQYRVSGYISHPVYFGSFMSILLPIFITYGLTANLPLAIPFSLIGIVVMLGTNSRTVWFTLALSFFLLFPYLRKKYQFLLTRKQGKILLAIFLLVSVIIIASRIQSITKIFSENGNGSIRVELIWQSLIMASEHPFGVGLNQFTQNLIDQKLPKSLDGFIVPVHNTFLIIITELGIVAASFFIFFIIKSIFFKKISTVPSLLTYGSIVGATTFLISSQFHPLFNLDPTFDLFMLTLGFINSQCQSSKT